VSQPELQLFSGVPELLEEDLAREPGGVESALFARPAHPGGRGHFRNSVLELRSRASLMGCRVFDKL